MADHIEHVGTLPDGREVCRAAFGISDIFATTKDGKPEGVAEHWIQIMPSGPLVAARDGRAFVISDMSKVVRATELPVLVDWEHKSEYGDTRAAGWVEELYVEAGVEPRFPKQGLWGRVEWTPEGADDTGAKKAYRFISPSILISSDTREVEKLLAVALTNRPALTMEAISTYREALSARVGPFAKEEPSMNAEQRKALCRSLGLPETATDEQIVSAQNERNTQFSSQQTSLSALQTEIERLKAEGNAAKAQAFAAEVTAVIDGAVRAGKLTPAQRASWQDFCLKGADNLSMFKTQLEAMPVVAPSSPIAPAQNSGAHVGGGKFADGKDIPAGMPAESYADCRKAGMTHERIVAAFSYSREQYEKRGGQSPIEAEE